MTLEAISKNADVMGGVPVFLGTRVPVAFMFDYLKAGESVETFLDHFPSVRRDVAVAALKIAEQLTCNDAHTAR